MEYSPMLAFIVMVVVAGIGYAMYAASQQNAEAEKLETMTPEARVAYLEQKALVEAASRGVLLHGPLNQAMICPHCQNKGGVHTKGITQKKGISGGKATGALLTGGASLLVTGLSRKEARTEAHCSNCKSTWYF